MDSKRSTKKSTDTSPSPAACATPFTASWKTLAALQNRWIIAPESCFVAEHERPLIGYALSHPWNDLDVPSLNSPLHEPQIIDLHYVHEVAIANAGRSGGAAFLLINVLISHASACSLRTMALTAVQGSSSFWEKYGFKGVDYHGDLRGYGDDAFHMKRT